MTLDGRRVIVTGGSRGIGRAIVLACAREGAAVVFTYASNATAAEETLAAARGLGATCAGFQSDVADGAAVTRAFQDAKTALGGAPDVLVNNAAVTHDAMLMLTNDAARDPRSGRTSRGRSSAAKRRSGMIAASGAASSTSSRRRRSSGRKGRLRMPRRRAASSR
jgi:3-oxoacyl-[acyl-carrier protein] reductase